MYNNDCNGWTTTPPAVLGEKRKRKSGHKTKKPCKKQKKFIASDEEASEGSPSDTDSAHSSHGDENDDGNDDESDDGNDDDAEPLPHSMRRRSNRGSASVAAAVLQDATSPVNVDSLPETISFASHTRLPSSCPDEPSLQPAAQSAHAVSSPVRSPQRTPPILSRPAIAVDDSSIQPASTAPQPAHAVTSPVRSSQLTPPIITRQAISVDDSWPEWFVKAHEHLTGPDLGPAFDNIISKYITFEKLLRSLRDFRLSDETRALAARTGLPRWRGGLVAGVRPLRRSPMYQDLRNSGGCGGKVCNPRGATLRLPRDP